MATLHRCRLIDRIVDNGAKIVTVVGGAGVGKTTLLGQLPNALLVTCRPDEQQDMLVTRIEEAATASPSTASERLLALDDMHLLGANGTTLQPIFDVLATLPGSWPLVVASRERIAGLSPLRLAGDVADIDEDDLRLTPAEANSIVDDDLARAYGYWPALIALARDQDAQAAGEYLVEEILPTVPRATRELLTALALTGGCERTTLSEIVGRGISDADVMELASIPLVDLDRDRLVAHPVWEGPLAGLLEPHRRRRLASRVGRAIVASDQTRACELLATTLTADSEVSSGTRTIARLGYSGVRSDVLSQWTALTSGASHESAEDLLMQGMLCRCTDPMAEEAVALLRAAADRFAVTGSAEGEAIALSELGFTHRMRAETEPMVSCLDRVRRLADLAPDGPEAAPIRIRGHFARAILADEEGDDRGILRHLSMVRQGGLPSHYGPAVSLLGLLAAFHLGDPLTMAHHADQFQQRAPRDRWWADHLPAIAAWHSGRPLGVVDQMPTAEQRRVGNPVDLIWVGASWAIIAALCGRSADADDALAVATAAYPGRTLPRLQSLVASARATVHAAGGDLDRARAAIEDALELDVSARANPVRSFHWCLAIVYVLAPDLREPIDRADLGPALATKRSAGRAFVAMRAGEQVDTSAEMWPPAEALAAALPVGWAADLAAWLTADGDDEGSNLAAALARLHRGRVRDSWRNSGCPGGDKLVRTQPIDPGATVDISLLGPVQLRIDGVESTHPSWSRDRVRALLALIVDRRSISRDEAIATLWPDFDETAGRRNLRVTLSHLQAVLEPGRVNGDAPYYLRADPQRLHLVGEPMVRVDAFRFEALLDRAAKEDLVGNGELVTELLAEATDLWRGDYLSDYRYDDWAQPSADRLRARYLHALMRLGRERLTQDRYDEALSLAERALRTEPWAEKAYELTIDAHLQAGDRISALRTLERYEHLLDELAIDCSPTMYGLATACRRPQADPVDS